MNTINKYLGTKTIDEFPHIRDFFIMKDSGKIPSNELTRYMKIKNENNINEYQERKKRCQLLKLSVRTKNK